MKHLLMVQSGCAGDPHAALQDSTALEAMRGTHLRPLAQEGRLGYMKMTREESDITVHFLAQCCGVPRTAAASLPMAPLAALALGLETPPSSLCVLGQFFVRDSAGRTQAIALNSAAEHHKLVEDLGRVVRETVSASLEAVALSDGRFLLVGSGLEKPLRERRQSPLVTHDARGRVRGRASSIRKALREAIDALLREHPVNQVRVDLGENPVSGVWLWGEGHPRDLDPLREWSQEGCCMVSSDLFALGLGKALGMELLPCDPLEQDGGRLDAAFDVAKLIDHLQRCGRVVVYIPPPFVGQPGRSPRDLVRDLDAVDYYFTGPLKAILEKHRPCRITVLAAGFRRDSLPEKGKVPVLIWGDGIEADSSRSLSEREMLSGGLGLIKPADLLELEQRR